jgi:hypothetical protein
MANSNTTIAFATGKGDDLANSALLTNAMIYVNDQGETLVRPRPALKTPEDGLPVTVSGAVNTLPQGMAMWVTDDAALGDYQEIYYVIDDHLIWDRFGGGRSFDMGGSISQDWRKVYFNKYLVSGVENLIIYSPLNINAIAGAGDSYIYSKVTAEATNPTDQTPSTGPYQAGYIQIPGLVQINGRLYIGTTIGEIYNCDLDDITTWSNTSFVTAERFSDELICIARHKDHLVAFGAESIEFMYDDGGSSGSPLVRRNDLYHSVGVRHPYCMSEYGDSITFVGTPTDGAIPGVYVMSQFQLQKISTASVDDDILKTIHARVERANLSCFATTVNTSVGTFYVLTLGRREEDAVGADESTYEAHVTWVYHYELDKWYKWNCDHANLYAITSGTSLDAIYTDAEASGTVFPIISSAQVISKHRNSSDSTEDAHPLVLLSDGRIRALATDQIIENETNVTMQIDVNAFDVNSYQRKRIHSVRLLSAPYYNTGAQECPFSISYTKEMPSDGTYSTARTIDYLDEHKVLYQQGICRQRKYRVTLDSGDVTSFTDVPYLKGFEIEFDVLRG